MVAHRDLTQLQKVAYRTLMETSRVIFFLFRIDYVSGILLLSLCCLLWKASQHSGKIFPKTEFDNFETNTTVI